MWVGVCGCEEKSVEYENKEERVLESNVIKRERVCNVCVCKRENVYIMCER